ncbi:MAG TPA: peptidylprolyl isomerase [Cyclobacteriaceae bacterium]|jgi:cyclophilin family peptidyl-prolyl cis-trans isomerase|nr:peptidylprolyl isomerase [Cyclobacteriaceae bacterium]HRF34669.1 peptidylprolyl isomerase [Cyclobacteriaceae bacterium]
MRFILLISFCLLIGACSKPGYFRSLSDSETVEIKKTKQQFKQDDSCRVLIITNYGNLVVKLFNETPLHRDNFVAKVKSGFYDSLLFHRVINNFMIQGGDPTSKKATESDRLGGGSAPGERIAAEFRTEQGIYHKRGALAAARDNNPEKASSNCQFYIVQRPAWRATQLDSTIVQRKLTLNDAQKQLYTTQGGTPHLDGGYTVFGELLSGYDVLDKIASTKTNPSDRPIEDVRMKMFVITEPKK